MLSTYLKLTRMIQVSYVPLPNQTTLQGESSIGSSFPGTYSHIISISSNVKIFRAIIFHQALDVQTVIGHFNNWPTSSLIYSLSSVVNIQTALIRLIFNQVS